MSQNHINKYKLIHMKNKNLRHLICIIILFFITSQNLYAQKEVEINGLKYKCEADSAIVVKNGDKNISGNIIIPDRITLDNKDYEVRGIGESAFSGCRDLLSIKVPKTLTNISWGAFLYCVQLGAIDFSNCINLKNIESSAFEKCTELRLVNLTGCNELSNIGERAFYCCESLTEIYLPDKIKIINEYTFCACYKLKKVKLPKDLISISENAFNSCVELDNINFPETLESIGRIAFRQCSNLSKIELGHCHKLNIIDSGAFISCGKLTQLTLPANLKTIGCEAFGNCYSLIYILYLGDKEPTICNNAFGWNKGLTLDLPNASKGFSEEKWGYATIKYGIIITFYTEVNGIKYTCSEDTAFISGYTNKPEGHLIIPEFVNHNNITYTVTDIGYGFSGCPKLISVTLPNTIKRFPKFGFSNNNNLSSVTFPTALERIESYAFFDCPLLTVINLSNCNNLSIIGDKAFYNCKGITDAYFPSSLTTLGVSCFENCTEIEELNFATNSIIKSIGKRAFYNCNLFNELNLPSSITKIEDEAFSSCAGLKKLDLSKCTNLEIIGNYAFYDCFFISDLFLPASISTIGRNTFELCDIKNIVYTGIKEPTIMGDAFSKTNSERFLYLPKATDGFNAINWGNNVIIEYGKWPAGISSQKSNENKIWVTDKTINIISQEGNNYSIISVNGTEVINGIMSNSIEEIKINTPGLYIVRIENSISKIIIE